jgi:predicted nucleic-acid-binding Zn-ribbon protein
MEDRCPKCAGEMDEGTISTSEGVKYISNRQTGVFKVVTPVHRARVCLTCGYVELYLDVEALKKKLAK